MTPEQRQYTQQRRDELAQELKDFAAGKGRPLYADPAERFQELRDELDRLECDLEQDHKRRAESQSEETDLGREG